MLIKKMKYNLIIAILLSFISIFFFTCIFENKNSQAAIESVSGNKYVLTSQVGGSVGHYFKDDGGNSTLYGSEISNEGGSYYSIVANTGVTLDKSSGGYAVVRFTNDIKEMIAKGILYATAEISFQAKNDNNQSNIKVVLSQGDNNVTFTTSYNNKEKTFYQSEMMLLDGLSNEIKFEWSTIEKTKAGEYSNFVLSEPTIKLYTKINNIVFSNTNQIVGAGQSIELIAYNDVLQINNVTGNLLSYSKINHKIEYVITEGSQYASIIGNYIFIDDNAPEGTKISVKARCRANSYEKDNFIEAKNVVTFTVSSTQVEVKIHTDFDDPAVISGEGVYNEGRRIFLRVLPKEKFNFKGWYINDELVSTSKNYSYVVKAGDKIYAKFVKDITISSISVNNKVYDGTTIINFEDIVYNFDGVEKQHNVYFTGASIHFASAVAGENKVIVVDNMENIVLSGEDSDKYNLTSQLVPQSYATILPRDILVSPQTLEKQYGDKEPALSYIAYGLIEGDKLTGSLEREKGEEIGKYKISVGSLFNQNYNIKLDDEYFFIITQRQLNISQLVAKDKVYDKTTNVSLNYTLENIYNNEDVDVIIDAKFEDYNAGTLKKVIINNIEIVGEDRENYTISSYPNEIYANIFKREITVKAINKNFIYGDEIDLSYEVSSLLEGDVLEGELSISDFNVGLHEITLGSLNNPNYQIIFENAVCQIEKRDAFVKADELVKEYGDSDPILTFTTENVLENDKLVGSLSREHGEEIGKYQITLGSLTNSNYNIIFESSIFEIIKREIVVEINFKDKIYDGSAIVEYDLQFNNKLNEQYLELDLNVKIDNGNVGIHEIKILSCQVNGDDIENCNFEFLYSNQSITISRRDVVISIENLEKYYGDSDPQLNYSVSGLVEGETLQGKPKRNVGENVGVYSYYLDSLNNENNPNYNIVYNDTAYLTILKRDINLRVNALSKIYGDEDPELKFELIDHSQLQFEDKIEYLFTGEISRENGENVGAYQILIEKLTFNENYNFIFENLIFVINKRPIVIQANDVEKIYGDEDPEFTYTTTNVLEDQPITVSIKRQYGENVGEYELMLESYNDARYSITFVPGYLNITPSKITLKASSKVKFYGDEDPYFDVVITDGLLKNNDVLSTITQGQLERENGENVGTYKINQGSFSLGKNYSIVFQTANLEIIEQPIKIVANYTQKQYGDADPSLNFKIVEGSLKFNDNFEGVLTREQGEEIGVYKINIGTLSLNENYILSFESNTFEITKRQIKIIPEVLSKIYGDEEPEMTYVIIGDLVEGDELVGSLFREKPTSLDNPLLYEEVGSYKIHSTLSHEKYIIEYEDNYYFKVLPRVIEIKADSSEKTYGEKDPKLTYKIVSGEILDGDSLTGNIYRVAGENSGTYDIRSSLTLGKNYTIIFQKGIFTINPIKIKIQSQNYSKIYGEFDPVFDYEIIEGELINNDILYGNIGREAGENVGVYKLVSNLSNINYEIELENAFMIIEKKDVYLKASVYDKIYDGTNKATIKTPVVSGLVDNDVMLSYDKNNCSYFVTSEVGNDIAVIFYDIKLVGEKADNYNLILPNNVVGNITYNQLSSQNETVVVKAVDNACLYYQTILNFSTFEIKREDMKLNKYQVLKGFEIWLENNGEKVEISNTISLTIKLNENYADRNNFYVYHKNDNGEYVLVNSTKNNGELVISIDELGEFVIMTDNDKWIDIASYVCVGVLTVFIVVYVVYYTKNKKRKN